MKILGFQSGHDVSYCVLENGVPIIHEELERFIREKEPLGDGLKMAFDRLPDDFFDDLKVFCYGNLNTRHRGLPVNHQEADDKMNQIIKNNDGKLYAISHHQSHAANAFFSSNFNEAMVITIDGSGTDKVDWKDCEKDVTDLKPNEYFSTSFTFWNGKDLDIEPIERIPMTTMTLGSPWRIYTREIFGLSSGHPHGLAAGTVMAMAAPGDSDKYWKDFYNAFKAGGGGPSQQTMNNCKKYKPIAERSEQDAFDVAAGIQRATEVVCREIMTPYIEKHNPKHICMSGGVVLNSVMIGKMYDWFPNVEQIYICPVPYDGGLAIGSAQYVYHQVLRNPRVKWKDNCTAYLGSTYEENEIVNVLNHWHKHGLNIRQTTDEEVIELLIKDKIVSVFGGGSESGRRALGNRSILADPRSPKMKDMINEKVKHRQWFRPFAPSILREDVEDWFEKDVDSPYMTTVLKWKKEVRDKVPAVVHLNNTARLQTVTENDNDWYYNFIKKFKNKTGVPILLNTSFNDREPIVETPEHAVNCFHGTNIDYLYFRDIGVLAHKMRFKAPFESDVTKDEFEGIYNIIKNKSSEKGMIEKCVDYLEIGCNAGGTLARILDNSIEDNLDIHVTGVDLFEDIVLESNDQKEQTHIHDELNINTVPVDIMNNMLLNNIIDELHVQTEKSSLNSENYPKNHKNQAFKGKFKLVKGYSDDVVPKLNKKFDVIFVDGNHTYKQCKKDFEMAFEKSKIGTDFIFHNAGIEEVDDCYPDGGPYKVCEELKKDKRLSYLSKPTKRVKVFRRVK